MHVQIIKPKLRCAARSSETQGFSSTFKVKHSSRKGRRKAGKKRPPAAHASLVPKQDMREGSVVNIYFTPGSDERSPIPPLSTLTSRATHAHPTSPRSTGFCAIWDCICSNSSSNTGPSFNRGSGGGARGCRPHAALGRHAKYTRAGRRSCWKVFILPVVICQLRTHAFP